MQRYADALGGARRTGIGPVLHSRNRLSNQSMKRVSVVCTVHEESGLADSDGLLAILDRIKPEVIFLEVPSAAFGDYFSRTRWDLESQAVGRYRDSHHVDLVPVDLPTPSRDFFRDNQDLFERIERRSPEYCRLLDRHRQYVRAYGFAYLNSDQCSALFSQLHQAILTAIGELADARLVELYELWIRTNELRDKEMVKNIESYSKASAFSIGAFLVGAAHRQSIVDLSRRQLGADSSTVTWDFASFAKSRHTAS